MPGGEKIKICNDKMINIVDSRAAGTAAHTRVPSPVAHGPAACSHMFCSSLCSPPLPLPHAPLRTQVFWRMHSYYANNIPIEIHLYNLPKSLSYLNPIISIINKKKVHSSETIWYVCIICACACISYVCVVCTCVEMYIHTHLGMTALGDMRESLD